MFRTSNKLKKIWLKELNPLISKDDIFSVFITNVGKNMKTNFQHLNK